jgi:hypothetical protein
MRTIRSSAIVSSEMSELGATLPTVEEALARAAEENGLPDYYRDIVKPLLREPYIWPRCCGSNCEPCAEQLIRVAKRTLMLLGREVPTST